MRGILSAAFRLCGSRLEQVLRDAGAIHSIIERQLEGVTALLDHGLMRTSHDIYANTSGVGAAVSPGVRARQ